MNSEASFIYAAGCRLYAEWISHKEQSNEKPIIIFLHEGLGSVAQWKDFPSALCSLTGLEGLVFDREGHGRSCALRQKRDSQFLHHQAINVLPEFYNQAGIANRKKIIIGHSDGGSIAIIHAAFQPEKIKCIITEAAHVLLEDITLQGIQDAVDNYENKRLKDLLQKYHAEKTDAMFYGWADTWLMESSMHWDIQSLLPQVNVPFLAIQGSNDQYGSLQQLIAIEQKAPFAQIALIEDCGHIPHHQKREEVLQKMKDFIHKYC